MEDIKQIVAKNIAELRQGSGMTQIDLAEKLNYSDKAVSKWERGESLPDVTVLCSIAALFKVTLDYLVTSDHSLHAAESTQKAIPVRTRRNHTMIAGMSILLVWLIATTVFVLVDIASPDASGHWLAFIYAVPVSMIVWLVFNSLWFSRRRNFLIISCLMWTVLAVIHLTLVATSFNPWQIYILGIPGQVIIIMWSKLRYKR